MGMHASTNPTMTNATMIVSEPGAWMCPPWTPLATTIKPSIALTAPQPNRLMRPEKAESTRLPAWPTQSSRFRAHLRR